MSDVRWTRGFWADKFDRCARVMVPNMWQLLSDTEVSSAYHNFLVAAGRAASLLSPDTVTASGSVCEVSEEDCVSCGACVQACPTATLMEKSIVEHGLPDHKVITTCAYCGVGCSFQAEMKGDQVVRMTPWKDGQANHGHSCVKGRFAWGYASHRDRVLKPMIRDNTSDPWREVSWDEAIGYAAKRFKEIQATYGRK